MARQRNSQQSYFKMGSPALGGAKKTGEVMRKFLGDMRHQLQDRWRNMAQFAWIKISRGAEARARCFSFAHGEGWRRTDKHQPHHNPPGHRMHKDK